MSNIAATTAPAPLDEVMLAMDVVDTLRHRQDLVTRELDEAGREQQLIEKLRAIYKQQGIDVPDHILREGVAALAESRFVYTPPKGGLNNTLARLYVSRGRWGRWGLALLLAIIIGFGGYFGVYRPIRAGQAEQARIELTEQLPARMDAIYQAIYEETKVQQAVEEADQLRSQGKAAAQTGDRAQAEAAISRMSAVLDTLRQSFTLRVVNRANVQSGFWTFPKVNNDATNYYLVVEAIDADGKPLTLPIRNEENGETEKVAMWGLRVPQDVYETVAKDKRDDGIIENNVVGVKQYGFLDTDYTMPVLGGTVTRW